MHIFFFFHHFFLIMHFSSLGQGTTRVMCIYFKLAGEEKRWNSIVIPFLAMKEIMSGSSMHS